MQSKPQNAVTRAIASAALLALLAGGCNSKYVGSPLPADNAGGGAAGQGSCGSTTPYRSPASIGNHPLAGGGEGALVLPDCAPTPTPRPTTGPRPTPTPRYSPPPTSAVFRVVIPQKLQGAIANDVRRKVDRMRALHLRPHGRLHPHYVSPSSAGVLVTATLHGTSTVYGTWTYNVSGTSSRCSGSESSRTCSISFPLAANTYDMQMQFYDAAPNTYGNIPNSANLLSETTVTTTIVANTANFITFDLEGVIAGLSPGTSFVSLPSGVAGSTAISISAVDADGNVITADSAHPYENPISVVISPGTAHGSIVKNGTNVGSSATLNYSSDTVSISYDGGGASGYGITTTLSAAGSTTGTEQISPLFVTGNITFGDQGVTKTLTITEANAPASITYSANNWTCGTVAANTKFTTVNSSPFGGSSATYQMTDPSAITSSPLYSTYSCSDVTITDSQGTTETSALDSSLSFSANIPINSLCSSDSTVSDYLGVKSSGKYQVSTGSPCAFTASGTGGMTVYVGPSAGGASYPTTGSITVSENNDESAVVTSGCSALGPNTGGTTPGTTPTGNLTGTVSFGTSSSNAPGSCNLTIKDGNGQSQVIPVTISTVVQTNSFNWNWTSNCNESVVGTDVTWTCNANPVSFDIGSNSGGATFTFSNTTNAVQLNIVASGVSSTGGCGGTGGATATITLTQGAKTWTIPSTGGNGPWPNGTVENIAMVLPNGAGTYEITLGGLYHCVDSGEDQFSYSGMYTGSVYTLPQGSGTVTPT